MWRKYDLSPWEFNARGERLSVIVAVSSTECIPEISQRQCDPLRPVLIDGPSIAHAYDEHYRFLEHLNYYHYVFRRNELKQNGVNYRNHEFNSLQKLPVLPLAQTLFTFVARGHKTSLFLPSFYDECATVDTYSVCRSSSPKISQKIQTNHQAEDLHIQSQDPQIFRDQPQNQPQNPQDRIIFETGTELARTGESSSITNSCVASFTLSPSSSNSTLENSKLTITIPLRHLVDDCSMLRRLVSMGLVKFLPTLPEIGDDQQQQQQSVRGRDTDAFRGGWFQSGILRENFQLQIREMARQAYGVLVTCDLIQAIDIVRVSSSTAANVEERPEEAGGSILQSSKSQSPAAKSALFNSSKNQCTDLDLDLALGSNCDSETYQELIDEIDSWDREVSVDDTDIDSGFDIDDMDDCTKLLSYYRSRIVELIRARDRKRAAQGFAVPSSNFDHQDTLNFNDPDSRKSHSFTSEENSAQGQPQQQETRETNSKSHQDKYFLPIIRPYFYQVLSRRQLSIPFDSPCFSGANPTCTEILVFKTRTDGDDAISILAKDGQLTLLEQCEQLTQLEKILAGRYPQGKKERQIVAMLRDWCERNVVNEELAKCRRGLHGTSDERDEDSVSNMVLFDDDFVDYGQMTTSERDAAKGCELSETSEEELILFDDDFIEANRLFG